jgi:hypothetical protein
MSDWVEDYESYDSMTIAELKELLKASGLNVAGKKHDLVQRLVFHDHPTSEFDQDAPIPLIGTGTWLREKWLDESFFRKWGFRKDDHLGVIKLALSFDRYELQNLLKEQDRAVSGPDEDLAARWSAIVTTRPRILPPPQQFERDWMFDRPTFISEYDYYMSVVSQLCPASINNLALKI